MHVRPLWWTEFREKVEDERKLLNNWAEATGWKYHRTIWIRVHSGGSLSHGFVLIRAHVKIPFNKGSLKSFRYLNTLEDTQI